MEGQHWKPGYHGLKRALFRCHHIRTTSHLQEVEERYPTQMSGRDGPGSRKLGASGPYGESCLGHSRNMFELPFEKCEHVLETQIFTSLSLPHLCAAHGHLTEQVCASTNYVGQCTNGLKCASDALAT